MKIKKKYPLLVLLALAMFGSVHAKEINILFMGNSFTSRQDMPNLVKEVFEEGQRNLKVNVERVTYGGQDMFRHHDLYFGESTVRLNSITISEIEEQIAVISSLLEKGKAPDFYDDYWEEAELRPIAWSKVQKSLKSALKRQQRLIKRIDDRKRVKWDYLVLQSWRDVVDDVNAGYAKYVQKWAKIAEKEGIKVILYVTAPSVQNAAPVKKAMNLEQTKMEMKTIHKLVDRINPYAVVPVALGIKNIQEDGTDLAFRYIKDSHLNQTTAFLTANMFYAAFFKESPEGFDFDTVTETKQVKKGKDPDGENAIVVFKRSTKELLQKVAYDTVMEFDAAAAR